MKSVKQMDLTADKSNEFEKSASDDHENSDVRRNRRHMHSWESESSSSESGTYSHEY